MTTYNTGNPVGSPAPKDLYDNAENLDTALHTGENTWVDRLGNTRTSWAGATGYQILGDYAGGIQITERNQIVREGGEYWRLKGSVDLPYTTTGTWAGDDEDRFVSVGDAVLRSELALDGGVFLVKDAVASVANVTELRALTGLVDGQVILNSLTGERYKVSLTDTGEDDGYDTIVSASGTRLLRIRHENRGGQSAASAYVETLDTGLSVGSPDNLRLGLSSETYSGGGFTEEMEIVVTGSKGSAILTSSDTVAVGGLGSSPFAAAIVSDSGDAQFVTVTGNNGSNQIFLNEALGSDFSGVLSAKYDAVLGQHLTKNAATAYAQHVAQASGIDSSAGAMMAGTWEHLPPEYNSLWEKNAALTSYGVSNSAAPIVQSALFLETSSRNIEGPDSLVHRPTADPAGVRIGTHLSGHGAVATMRLRRKPVVIEFWTGAFRDDTSLTGVEIIVSVEADGRTLYSGTHSHVAKKVTIPVEDADEVVISVENGDGSIYYIELLQLTVRDAGTQGLLVNAQSKVVTLGDSWFAYYDGWFAKKLAEATGATVINRALGGQTTEWALSWFDEYVLSESPDVCVFHFFTNDGNDLSAQTFIDPDGNNQPKWPSGLTDAQSQQHWRENLRELAYRCQANGIKPVFILPGGTASLGQTQKHADWRYGVNPGFPDSSFNATSALLSDAGSFPNVYGKSEGSTVVVGSSYRFATGSSASAPWANTAEDGLAELQKLTLVAADYSAPFSFDIGTDTDLDGLSDGVSFLTVGTIETNGETFTPSIASGAQRFEAAFTSPNDGQKRLKFDFSVDSGKEYLLVADVVNGPLSAALEFFGNLDGGYTLPAASGRTLDGAGAGQCFMRETADSTKTASVLLNATRSNGSTISFDVVSVYCIDLDALFVVAPNARNMSDGELASFVSQLQ